MSKPCTVLAYQGDELKAVEFSLVDDNHQFGWRNGELHVEGNVEVVDDGDSWAIVPQEELEQDDDEDEADAIDTSYL